MKPNNKPSLLLLTSSFPSSPDDETCGYIRDLARSLALEFDVVVLAPPDRKKPDRRNVECPAETFTVTRSRSVLPAAWDPFRSGDDLNSLADKNPLAKLAALISIVCFFAYAIALALKADAICSNWLVPSGFAGAGISRLLGKPHISIEHSGALHLLSRMRGGKRIARFVVGGSNRIVTVSEDLKHKLVRLCPHAANKIEVIPMGIKLPSADDEYIRADSFLRSDINPTVLFIGRLAEIKGLPVLLHALEGLDGLRLIVAGSGEALDENQRIARRLSLNARFVGRVGAKEKQRLLSACDAVVIPSIALADGRSEGTPVVCLEAMAAGRAVIASRVGGLAEVISDGENGLLFEQGDHLMLKEKLLLALSDDRLRQRLARSGQRSVASYDWKRIGLRYADVLKGALASN